MKCVKCCRDKPITEFIWKNKSKGKRAVYCKVCLRKVRKKWYAKDREKHIKRVRANSKRYYTEGRIKVWEYFKSHPCVDCEEDDPIVLEFDHIDQEDKSFDIGSKLGSKSWKLILKEIEKCEVRCANCHRRRTAKQRGYYQYLNAPIVQLDRTSVS